MICTKATIFGSFCGLSPNLECSVRVGIFEGGYLWVEYLLLNVTKYSMLKNAYLEVSVLLFMDENAQIWPI